LESLMTIGGFLLVILLVIGMLYLIALLGKGSLAVKLQGMFRWVFLKTGLAKEDGTGV